MNTSGVDASASTSDPESATSDSDAELQDAIRRAEVAKMDLRLAEAEIAAATAEKSLSNIRAKSRSQMAGNVPAAARSHSVREGSASTEVPDAGLVPDCEIKGEPSASDTAPTEQRMPSLGASGLLLRRGVMAAAALVGIVLLITAVALQLQHKQSDDSRTKDAAIVAAASQGVVEMLSIDHATADADIASILDDATGEWKSDFEGRSGSFASVVRDASVSTTGEVLGAGLEAHNPDGSSTVLVAARSKVTNTAGADEEPRSWRLRVGVTEQDGSFKISKMEFVP